MKTISPKKDLSGSENQYTLLFVDDEKKVLKSMQRLFRKSSYKILTAESAL